MCILFFISFQILYQLELLELEETVGQDPEIDSGSLRIMVRYST